MFRQHRVALALVACAAATAGGALLVQATSAPGAGPGTDRGLDGLTGQQIADKAVRQLNSASSLRLKLKAADLEMRLSLDENANCAGKLRIPGKGSVKLIKRGDTVWMRPSAAFWRHQLGGERGAAAAERFQGRYIKGRADDSLLGGSGLATACDLDAFRAAAGADDEGAAERWRRGPAGTVRGHTAVPVTREQDGVEVTMLVADRGKPYPLKLQRRAGAERDEIQLGRFDEPVPRGTPPARQTVDVTELREQLRRPPAKEV
ncbi:hypothetical protein [Streptomyces boncukensis]|uniref:Lipoprotein n=1 Tax=Streptomyces boncukensis TaxID=2711219 RepID=A0A6G4WZT9_9ACTN|nr:hypothetical protein [Streptomyces boncukensis]NGO70648.1 hypothetical protein [Streptomyces boncukensis]